MLVPYCHPMEPTEKKAEREQEEVLVAPALVKVIPSAVTNKPQNLSGLGQ